MPGADDVPAPPILNPSNIANVAPYVEPQANPPSSYPHSVRPETRVISARESDRKERRER